MANNKTVIVHDERLEGFVDAPGQAVFRVNEKICLQELVAGLSASCLQGEFRMIVLCHGNKDKGLQLCQENLTLETVNLLAPLRGFFSRGVMLNACQAARGNGTFLCGRIASVMAAPVEASARNQNSDLFPIDGVLYFSETRWQGQVYTWDECGTLLGKRRVGRKAKEDWIVPPFDE